MMVRIVAGEHRGRKIATLPESDQSIRPTSDRAREAIFNILRSNYGLPEGARVLDLCCGTGALGFEALSRGAVHVTFIDSNNIALRLVKATAQAFGATDKVKILFADAQNLPPACHAERSEGSGINKGKNVDPSYVLGMTECRFDLIFCDPPYNKGIIPPALAELAKKGYIKPGTLLVLETGKNEQLALPEGYIQMDTRQYGIAKIWFVRS